MQMLLKVAKFFILVGMAIGFDYFTSPVIASLFYLVTLIVYFIDKPENEGFWLAFYIVLSDGFIGFFGLYEVVMTIIPGLPAVEVGQLYIILTVVKASYLKVEKPLFYAPLLRILFIYLIFLIVQGYVIGINLSLNVQFRVIKWMIPFLLFYSLPRLYQSVRQYKEIFVYLFPVAIFTLGAQFFTIVYGIAPSQYFGVQKELWFVIDVTADRTYRGMYSEAITIITYFGAFFFLVYKEKYFHPLYLMAVIGANFLSVYLSATRGLVLSFSFILLFAIIFTFHLSIKRLVIMALVGVGLFFGAKSIPVIGNQLTNAFARIATIGKLAQGDATAGGTLIRLTERGPRVIKKWEESPLTGWGFSESFMHNSDTHVGNQNILQHSGIIGALLLITFFGYFMLKLFIRSIKLPSGHVAKDGLMLFVVFFPGWFILHSTSGQYFGYHVLLGPGLVEGLFFCMAGLVYNESFTKAEEPLPKIEEMKPQLTENFSWN